MYMWRWLRRLLPVDPAITSNRGGAGLRVVMAVCKSYLNRIRGDRRHSISRVDVGVIASDTVQQPSCVDASFVCYLPYRLCY